MTVDDLVLKLHDLQNKGKGKLRIAIEVPFEWDVRTTSGCQEVTVQFDARSDGKSEKGRLVDGRGRPKDTERVIQII